jgi:hypothetical protein
MIQWYLMEAGAAAAVIWAVLSAYIRVRVRMRRAENRPAGREH